MVLFPATDAVNGLDEETRNALKLLLEKGVMGAGVLHTPNVRATYEELKSKGVQFKSEPVSPTVGPNKGGWAVYFVDPDGVTLEMIQRSAASSARRRR